MRIVLKEGIIEMECTARIKLMHQNDGNKYYCPVKYRHVVVPLTCVTLNKVQATP